ncbi:hypothetical protein PO124_11265 [Bacillus licheniformis]|nr:hypothetical protein [Bacillus licheniformis]
MITWFKYITPYYYSVLGGSFIFINFVYAAIVLCGAIVCLKERFIMNVVIEAKG